MSKLNHLATRPPLGWNSWDCYGTSVREDEVKANAEFMASRLASYGWQYVVVDIQWSEPDAKAGGYRPNADLVMDDYGRLTPALNRFPSAKNGLGFKPLGDYIHSLGLKFGIHIMRGIPRRAVQRNLPILNSPYHAQDIADTNSVCHWNDDMYGIDVGKPGATAYYDSLLALYTHWGVDYLKADDMIAPTYHGPEVEALSKAIQRSRREIVLSLSPGTELSTEHYDHLKQHAELWRITNDLWDRWSDVDYQFGVCAKWASFGGQGCWPDADMLPLGHIGIRAERGVDRQSLLTHDEQITLMSLWSIFRSPLMVGGDLPTSDDFALGLLTNAEVLAINQESSNNRELWRKAEQIVWTADVPGSQDRYLSLFNVGETPTTIEVDLSQLGGTAYQARDLWQKSDEGLVQGVLRREVAPHATKLYRLKGLTSG